MIEQKDNKKNKSKWICQNSTINFSTFRITGNPLLIQFDKDKSNQNSVSFYFQVSQQQRKKKLPLFHYDLQAQILFKQQIINNIFLKKSTLDTFKLQILNLSSCTLTNLQFLYYLQTPNLVNLLLKSNSISSFIPLAKTRFKKLRKLCIYNNFTKEISPIHRCTFQNEQRSNQHQNEQNIRIYKNKVLSIDKISQEMNKTLQDIRTIVKIQLDGITFLQISSRKRLNTKRIVQSINQKYLKADNTYFLDYRLVGGCRYIGTPSEHRMLINSQF